MLWRRKRTPALTMNVTTLPAQWLKNRWVQRAGSEHGMPWANGVSRDLFIIQNVELYVSHSMAKSNNFLPLRFSLAWTSRPCYNFQLEGMWVWIGAVDVTGLLGGGWFLQSAQKARWELSCRDERAAVGGSRKRCKRVWTVMESKNNLVTISWAEGELQWFSFRGELGGRVLLEEDKTASRVREWVVQWLCLCHTDALSGLFL